MTTKAAPKKTYELVAIILLLPALFIELQWLLVSSGNQTMSPEAKAATFLESFPSVFSSATVLLAIGFIFSVLAIVFACRSFNQTKMAWRISSFVVVFIGAIVALLTVFQMF